MMADDFAFNPIQGWDVDNPPKPDDKSYDPNNKGRQMLKDREYGSMTRKRNDGKWPKD